MQEVTPSVRGEYEITDLNKIYLDQQRLDMQLLGRGFSWLDTGTMAPLFEASNYVRSIEEVQGISISVPEEITFYNGWIIKEQVLGQAEKYGNVWKQGNHLKSIYFRKRYLIQLFNRVAENNNMFI